MNKQFKIYDFDETSPKMNYDWFVTNGKLNIIKLENALDGWGILTIYAERKESDYITDYTLEYSRGYDNSNMFFASQNDLNKTLTLWVF